MSACLHSCDSESILPESNYHRNYMYNNDLIKRRIQCKELSYFTLQNLFYHSINDDCPLEELKQILQCYPSIITETVKHPSPLVKAANLKFPDKFDLFLQYVDVNTLDKYNTLCETPLMCAVKHEYSLAVMRLVEAGANVFHRCLNTVSLFGTFEVKNCSLLHLAATYKTSSIGYYLIKAGCDIFSESETGKTCLFYLSNVMKSKILKEMRNRNINDVETIKTMDAFNEILYRCMEIRTGSRIETALAYQYSITNYLKSMSMLFCALEKGLSNCAKDILETASKYGYPNTCYLMLKHGGDLDTAIHYFYKGPYITGWHNCEENPDAPHLTCFIIFLLEGATKEHIRR